MIASRSAVRLELSINENFSVSVKDLSTMEIYGVFDRDELIEAVKDMDLSPDEVFEPAQLTQWARDNGME